MKPVIAIAAAAMLVAGCASGKDRPKTVTGITDWRAAATDADRDRVRQWRRAWDEARATIHAAGKDALLSDTQLFDMDRALAKAMPPAGDYHCRIFKLGGKATAVAPFTSYPKIACHIGADGELARFAVTEGPQRPQGLLFPESDARAVFLGTMVLGDERIAFAYGRDGTRDTAGYVERIGERRWRLVLPYPHFESTLDVVEITPG